MGLNKKIYNSPQQLREALWTAIILRAFHSNSYN